MPRKTSTATPQSPAPHPSSLRDFQLRVTLAGSKPPIWRKVLVPGEFTLAQVHDVLQTVMPWENSHLHAFTIRKKVYTEPSPDGEKLHPQELNERKWTLSQVLTEEKLKFTYEYDFGDSWMHEILVEKILPADPGRPRQPLCLDGKNAAPPEDSGGLWGYYEKIELLDEPELDEEEEERLEWLGRDFDPKAFSVEETNKRLAKRFPASKSPAKGSSRGKQGTPAPPSGPRVWAGTILDASDVLGMPPSSTGAPKPIVAVWFDVTDPADVQLATAMPGYAGTPESPLIQSLLNPLPTGPASVLRPVRVLGATRQDIEILREQNFESISIDPTPHPEVLKWSRKFLSELMDIAGDFEETDEEEDEEGEDIELGELVPIPGEPGIDEAFARSWCEATLAYKRAHTPTVSSAAHAFHVTFPGGETRVVTLHSPAGLLSSLVLYSSDEDRKQVEGHFQERMDRELALLRGEEENDEEEEDDETGDENLPLVLALNFEHNNEINDDHREYLIQHAADWKRQHYSPYQIRVEKGEFEPPTADDFRLLGQAAFAFALLLGQYKKPRSWPPETGFETEVTIPWQGKQESLRIRDLGK